jgi:carboxylesterase type B
MPDAAHEEDASSGATEVTTTLGRLALLVTLSAMCPNDFAAVLAFYGAREQVDANALLVSVMDDSWTRCSSRVLAQQAAQRGADVYVYSFELAPAVHIQDLDYVFDLELPY